MSKNTETIKCNPCNVPLQGPAEYDNHSVFYCPLCGESDTVEHIIAEASDYAKNLAGEYLNKHLESVARKSSFITVKKTFSVKKNHRFKIDAI